MKQIIEDNVKSIDVVSCIDSKLVISNTDTNSLETNRAKIKFLKGITYFDSVLPLPTDLIHIICEYCSNETNFSVSRQPRWIEVRHDLFCFEYDKTWNMIRLEFKNLYLNKPHYHIIDTDYMKFKGFQWVWGNFLYLYHDVVISKKDINDRKSDVNIKSRQYLYHQECSVEVIKRFEISATIHPCKIKDYHIFGEYYEGVLKFWVLISKDIEIRNILLDLYHVVEQLR